MSAQEQALAFLREQMGEGWRLDAIQMDPPSRYWMVWAMRGLPTSVEIVGRGPDPMSAAKACVEAWREATKQVTQNVLYAKLDAERAHADRLAEALREHGEHGRGCVLARWEAGRPTESGGYEMCYAGSWYETRPNDRTPACTCGLADVLAAHGARE